MRTTLLAIATLTASALLAAQVSAQDGGVERQRGARASMYQGRNRNRGPEQTETVSRRIGLRSGAGSEGKFQSFISAGSPSSNGSSSAFKANSSFFPVKIRLGGRSVPQWRQRGSEGWIGALQLGHCIFVADQLPLLRELRTNKY